MEYNMKIFTTVLYVLILYCISVTSQAIEVSTLKLSNKSQTKNLSILEIELPSTYFEKYAGKKYLSSSWRVKSKNGNLEQLFFDARTDGIIKLYGLLKEPQSDELLFYYSKNGLDFKKVTFNVEIDPAKASSGDSSLLQKWSEVRRKRFGYYGYRKADSDLAKLWWKLSAYIYENKEFDKLREPVSRFRNTRRRSRRNDVTAFSLFSGEAAIQETLQKQLLTSNKKDNTLAPEIIDQLEGPQVPSHPFAEMLQADSNITPLPIASLVPADRYFIHLNDPNNILVWLEKISKGGNKIVGLQKSDYLRRDVLNRYLQRLHLSYDLVKQLTPYIKQAALFGPDLFLTTGSELTIVLDINDSLLFKTVLTPLLGMLPNAEVGSYGKNPAYFAYHGQWLILSTSKTEAKAALALAKNYGKDSLGHSAEFRYMLKKLPNQEEILVYLSDPFIRAMVGPRIKIGQYRRHKAKTKLNLVTAALLLYQMDQGKTPTLDELLATGYLEQKWLQSDENDQITLNEQGIPYSKLYGTLENMFPINRLALEKITIEERDSYKNYVKNYSRFWRTFFDPIGIRIKISNPLKIETLILPLVENSIYRSIQQSIGGETVTIGLPKFEPQPITTLSFKKPSDDILTKFLYSLHFIHPEIFKETLDSLGDNFHISFYDSDPIVTLGSADLIGAFSGRFLTGNNSSINQFFWPALIGSMFTQSTSVFLQLKDSTQLSELWQQRLFIKTLLPQVSDFPRFELFKQKDEGWVYTLNIENVIRFHLYIQKVDDYLVFSNWQVKTKKIAENNPDVKANARIHIEPEQIEKMYSDLHLHHMQHRQSVAIKHIGRLMPFLWLGAKNPQQAITWHKKFYGSEPLVLGNETWHWDPLTQNLENSVFGSLTYPKLPSSSEPNSEEFSVSPFSNLKDFDLRFGFEEAGARIKLKITY